MCLSVSFATLWAPGSKEPLSFQVLAQIPKGTNQAFGDCPLNHTILRVSREASFPGSFTRA